MRAVVAIPGDGEFGAIATAGDLRGKRDAADFGEVGGWCPGCAAVVTRRGLDDVVRAVGALPGGGEFGAVATAGDLRVIRVAADCGEVGGW